jgi:hypothetical protein
MKSLIVDTCGKSALSAYEKTYSSLPGEKASEMGEREEEGDDEKYAKADAFLSKLKHAGGKKEDQEEDEDVEIDSSKNTDTFLREFNDMQKRMKETKKFANEEEDDLGGKGGFFFGRGANGGRARGREVREEVDEDFGQRRYRRRGRRRGKAPTPIIEEEAIVVFGSEKQQPQQHF